ncbi:MAG: hypothetical protein U0457_15135 [Candidatus Sericytochromatia bacterium]
MTFTKKIFYSLMFCLFSTNSLTSCTLINQIDLQKTSQKEENQIKIFANDGNVNITLPLKVISKDKFSTKSNRNGTFFGAYQSVKLFLSKNSSDPINNPAAPPSILSQAQISSNNGNLSFYGLAPNTTYYMAAQAFDGAGGTGTNVTLGEFSISPESLQISPDGYSYTLNEIAPNGVWDIDLTTKSSTGAALDSRVGIKTGRDFFASNNEFTLNTNFTQPQVFADISINDLGNGMSIWKQTNAGNDDIRLNLITDYLPNGIDYVLKNATTAIGLSTPNVTINNKGNGLAVWFESQGNSVQGAYIRNFTPTITGVPFTSLDTTIISSANYAALTSTNLKEVKAKISRTSSVGVIATSASFTSNLGSIHIRKFSSTPTPTDFSSGITLDAFTGLGLTNLVRQGNATVEYLNPDISNIAPNPSNDFVITYQASSNTNTLNEIEMRKISLLPSVNMGAVTFVSQNKTAFTQSYNFNPSVQINDNGNGLVVWERGTGLGSDKKIYARKLENFIPVGNEFQVEPNAPSSTQLSPQVSIDNNGNGLIAWKDNRVAYPASNHIIYGVKLVDYFPSGDVFPILKKNNLTSNTTEDIRMENNSLGKGLIICSCNLSGDPNTPDIYAVRLRDFYPQ